MRTPDASFGARFRKARRELGLSQSEAAEGIATASFLSLVESGKRLPSPRLAAELAARVGIPVDPEVDDPAPETLTLAMTAIRAADLTSAQQHAQTLPSGSAERALVDGLLLELQGGLEDSRRMLADAMSRAAVGSELWLECAAALCRVAFNAGAVAQAIEAGEAALSAGADRGPRSEDLIVEIRASLSGVYCDAGNLSRARELVDGDLESATPWQRGTQLWARSIVAIVSGEPTAANAYATEALRLFREADRPLSLARLQVNAAALHTQDPTANAADAVHLLDSAERTFRHYGTPLDLSGCLTARAHIDALQGEHEEARVRVGEALLLVRDEGAGMRARIYAAAAITFLLLGDRASAEAHLLEARHLLETAGANRAAAATWRQLAAAYEEMGQLDLALACMKAATDLLGLHVQSSASASSPA